MTDCVYLKVFVEWHRGMGLQWPWVRRLNQGRGWWRVVGRLLVMVGWPVVLLFGGLVVWLRTVVWQGGRGQQLWGMVVAPAQWGTFEFGILQEKMCYMDFTARQGDTK